MASMEVMANRGERWQNMSTCRWAVRTPASGAYLLISALDEQDVLPVPEEAVGAALLFEKVGAQLLFFVAVISLDS